jgi:hypothetical protein
VHSTNVTIGNPEFLALRYTLLMSRLPRAGHPASKRTSSVSDRNGVTAPGTMLPVTGRELSASAAPVESALTTPLECGALSENVMPEMQCNVWPVIGWSEVYPCTG